MTQRGSVLGVGPAGGSVQSAAAALIPCLPACTARRSLRARADQVKPEQVSSLSLAAKGFRVPRSSAVLPVVPWTQKGAGLHEGTCDLVGGPRGHRARAASARALGWIWGKNVSKFPQT